MRSPIELQMDAWTAIVDALGPADALRYRALFEPGQRDYAAERSELFAEMTIDDWVEEVRRSEAEGDPRR